MYLQGYLQAEIAEVLGVSQPQISYDLARIREQWRESALIDFNEAKNRELERIDLLEREYWEQWKKSKEGGVKTKGQKKIGGEVVETTVQVESGLGDVRYLQGVQWCIERRCKILGVDAPRRTELTGAEGEPISISTIVVREHVEGD
jgi:hypothetical protein